MGNKFFCLHVFESLVGSLGWMFVGLSCKLIFVRELVVGLECQLLSF